MTISELYIQLDISLGNETKVLKQHAHETSNGYIFVDSSNGQCYLLDKHGKLDDIRKVKNIESWAFEYCISLKSIIIPDSVESIENGAFSSCTSLENITITSSVKSIGHSAFWNCASLESITLPDSIESIRYATFLDCKSLKSIIIPDSVESIGECAFYNCTSLKEVIFKEKTVGQVKAMDCYPWGIKDTNVIKCR